MGRDCVAACTPQPSGCWLTEHSSRCRAEKAVTRVERSETRGFARAPPTATRFAAYNISFIEVAQARGGMPLPRQGWFGIACIQLTAESRTGPFGPVLDFNNDYRPAAYRPCRSRSLLGREPKYSARSAMSWSLSWVACGVISAFWRSPERYCCSECAR